MFAYGIDKKVLSVAGTEKALKARQEAEPGVFVGWIKPVVEDKAQVPQGMVFDKYEYELKKDKVLQKIVWRKPNAEEIAAKRVVEYPPVGEQLDAIYKLAQMLQAQGMQLPEETGAWVDKLTAVKRNNPKGTVA